MPTITTEGLIGPVGYTNNDNTAAAAGLPIDLATTTWRTVYRVICPCQPGDVFRVHGEVRVTNDAGRDPGETRYTVGVGYHLWYYDLDDTSGVPLAERMVKFGDSDGDNVDPVRHHMPGDITRWLKVPADWPVDPLTGLGHRVVLVLRADAHSTAWEANGGGEVLTVDRYGLIDALRWTTPTRPLS